MARVTEDRIATAVARFFAGPDVAGGMELLGRRLPDGARILVTGGAIRNIIIDMVHGSAPLTNDIDIFIGGVPRHFSLTAMLKHETVHPTDLGGLRWQPASSAYAYDLCLLSDFIIIHTYRLEPSLQSLLAGIDLTINAIIYDYRCRTLHENGCLSAIRERIIDFNSHLIPDKCLIAYRLLLMAHKTAFRFSEKAFHFLTRRVDVETLIHLRRVLRAKQGKPVATRMMGDFDRVCGYPTYADYLRDIQ